jgi:hypothetical protein
MIYWIKRGARLFGGGVFFVVLIGMLLRPDALILPNLLTSFAYALLSGGVAWFIGIVISDILLKGVMTDIGDLGVPALLEGGIVQRMQNMQEELVPGGSELPFSDEVAATGPKGKRGAGKGK